jgi:diadenosine tetraphosphatase ApaH/serine/threonine PP2A family protein phosphatase
MRAIVVADVHANLEAFEAVLHDAGERGRFDALWSLGDLVGYGADPEPCVDLLQSYPYEAIVGNHDLAAVGVIGIEDFNPYAAAAARWTQEKLSAVTKVWMMSLPQIVVHDSGFTLVHGSLVDPIWEYLILSDNATEHLARQTTPYGLVGHTHMPRVFYDARLDAMSTDISDGATLAMDDLRFVANPGSVGQPRDGDPRAAYAIVDTDASSVSFHRVAYDLAATQEKMRAAGLPIFLAERLAQGR